MEQSMFFHGTVVTVNDKEMSKSNGKLYKLVEVLFSDGPLAGKTYTAQRTIGENKAEVTLGQNVRCYVSTVKDPETGKTRAFFEVSTSKVDISPDDVVALLGL